MAMASEDDETPSENDAADFDIVSAEDDEQVATLLSDLKLNTQRKLIRRDLTDPCVTSVSADCALFNICCSQLQPLALHRRRR